MDTQCIVSCENIQGGNCLSQSNYYLCLFTYIRIQQNRTNKKYFVNKYYVHKAVSIQTPIKEMSINFYVYLYDVSSIFFSFHIFNIHIIQMLYTHPHGIFFYDRMTTQFYALCIKI